MKTFARVERASPTLEELEGFTGIFFSGELGISFEFMRQDHRLIFGGLSLPLEPTMRDCFRADLDMHFEFFRDDGGQVEGFAFFCGGANGIRFARKQNML